MTYALSEDQARAAESSARERKIGRVLDEMRHSGVSERSIEAVRIGMERARTVGGDDVLGPIGETINAERYDPFLEAYLPDPKNDLAARLRQQLASKTPPTLEVQCRQDGRDERVTFKAAEAKAYFESDWPAQDGLRTAKIRERRLRTAIDAAARVRESGGRRAEIPVENGLSNVELLCLLEYGGLDVTAKRGVDENGKRVLRSTVTLREGWATPARRALRERQDDLEPVKLRARFGSPEPRAIRESWGLDGGGFPEIYVPPVGGLVGTDIAYPAERYHQYGPQVLQMRLSDVWDAQTKSRFAYERDPLCKQGIKIGSNFVLGRGFSVDASDQQNVQPVLDDFDKRHPEQMKKGWLRYAKVMGEIFLWRQSLGGGKVRFVVLPAQSIWYVVHVADDLTAILYYVQRYTTDYQPFAGPDNASHYVDRIIPANEVYHFKRNADLDDVRGLPDTYAALPWHLKFRNHWEAQVEKDYASAAYAYVVKVKGNDAQVRGFIKTSLPKHRPRPGSYHVFNDKVESFQVVSSDKNAPSGVGSTSNGILNVLAANYGFAKEYFGVDGNRTRGGQVISAGPAEKSFEDEQDDWGEFMERLYGAAIDEANAYELIPAGVDTAFKVNFPDIIKADSVQTVQLLVVGRAQGWISHQTSAALFAAAIDIGDTYDYQAEQALIKEEAANGITLPGMPPKFDTIDPTQSPQPPDPRSAAGAAQIRKDDRGAADESLDEFSDDMLAEALSARGHVIVMA